MSFDWDGLYNPIFAYKNSVRDPSAIFHNGLYYLYFTIQFQQFRWDAPEGYQIFMMTTPDFREFTNPVPITPKGFVSPGNVIQHNGRWIMSITRYPWPTAVATIESDDLVHWSEPHVVVPTFHGSYWGNDAHGPIDGYIFKWQEQVWMFYSDYKKGTHAQHLGLARAKDDACREFENLTVDDALLDSSYYDEFRGIENASIINDGDKLYLFCSVGMPEQHVAVLESNDIMKWPKLDKSAELSGLNQDWTKFIAAAQFVADWRKEMGHWIMLYMGARFQDAHARMALGMAYSDDLKHWTPLPEGVSDEVYEGYVKAFRQRYLNGELTDGIVNNPNNF